MQAAKSKENGDMQAAKLSKGKWRYASSKAVSRLSDTRYSAKGRKWKWRYAGSKARLKED